MMTIKTNRVFNTEHFRRSANSNHNSSISTILTEPSREVWAKLPRPSLFETNSVGRCTKVRSWLVDNLKNYCNTTSLHGLNYVANKDITPRERYFWMAIVMVAIIVSIVLVAVSWLWNRETPTVTVIESSHFAAFNIPFPAVTICGFNKISKAKAEVIAKSMKRPDNMTDSELMKLFRVTMYFNFDGVTESADIDLFQRILEYNNMTNKQLTNLLMPDCMDMIWRCIWKGTNMRCDSLFQRIDTWEGTCCSFNYFGRRTNTFSQKIAYQIPKRPYRVTGCGYSTGLTVLLNPNIDDYFATYFSSYGFRLHIHNSYNFPDDNSQNKVITATKESFVRINPESTYATADVKRMAVSERNCLFSHERKMDVLQNYSFINCMAECRMKIMFERCDCLPVNFLNNGSYKTCEIQQLACVAKNREIFSKSLPNVNSSWTSNYKMRSFPCGCLPDCELISYPSEVTMGTLKTKGVMRTLLVTNETNFDKKLLLHVFFSDLMTTRYRMEIFQNWLSTLASFGGLLGLIMGFSIVSAFEFVYFLTFRPIFNHFNDM